MTQNEQHARPTALGESAVRSQVGVEVRRATAGDLPAIRLADCRAFGLPYHADELDELRELFDPDRFLLAFDPDTGAIVGITGDYPFDVTLPGGATLPVPGVSWVSVAVTHRRRGVLRRLLDEQHRGFVADRAAVSLLTASEGGIYGRFGYGTATVHRSVEIDRRRAVVRPDVPDPGGVRFVDDDEFRALAPPIHRRWVAATPGALSRSDLWWNSLMRDHPHRRRGAPPMFRIAHPDGYACYRIQRESDVCEVVSLVAVTDAAHAALWRVLLGLDLVETIRAFSRPLEDPLPELLTDPRQVRTTGLHDGMWARILDVPAALSARRYTTEIDVVLDVRDPFLDRGGRFRLRGGPDGAECVPVERGGPLGAVGVETAALGGLLFGGRRATTLARAGRLEAPDAQLLRRLDLALLADRSPEHGTEF